MTPVAGLVLAVAVVGSLAASPGPPLAERPDAAASRVSPSPADPTTAGEAGELPPDVVEELEDLLDRLASALLDADADAVTRALDDPSAEVGERWRTRASNLDGVPLAQLRLELAHHLGDLTTARVRARYPERDAVVVGVVEEHVLADQDLDGPARHPHTLTFVRDDGTWRLAEDRDGRALGRPEPGFLWDLAPVASTRAGPVLALHPPQVDVTDLVAETRAAMALLPDRWPAPWSQRTTLVVPDDREQVTHVIGEALDLDDFLAFTSATTSSAPGHHEITGARLVVNPGRFPATPTARERVLLHELVHVATRPVASARLPMWLEEGVAQALGEQGPATAHTGQLDALGPAGRRLPTDAEFSTAGRQATFLAYQRAYRFVDHLRQRAGRDAVVDFYAAVGTSATGPGTLGHRMDVAAVEHLGDELDALVADWRAAG